MNVYDTANRLASELRQSKEYLDYKRIKQELDQNQEVKEKIREFEEKRYAVQLEDVNKIIAESVQDVIQ